ncbi:HupE/UreJ family protein [Nitrospira sp. Nam74]
MKPYRYSIRLVFIICSLLGLQPDVSAHPLDPALLEVWESSGMLEVLWRQPLRQRAGASVQPVLPAVCRPLSTPAASVMGSTVTARWRLDCGASQLVGAQIGVEGLAERQMEALVRVHLADGRLLQRVLRGDSQRFTVPQRSSLLEVARDYLVLGVEHILTGGDHLLFVLGLVLLVLGTRELLWTVTAFTVGHSVTLAAATLGFVRIPPAPVEVLIALSIVFVGVELARQGERRAGWSCPWMMAGSFGLLHGFGFAGALAQIGLPANEIPLALLTFNVGIELGQVIFVIVILLVKATLRVPVRLPEVVTMVPAYVIGSVAACWCLERIVMIVAAWRF